MGVKKNVSEYIDIAFMCLAALMGMIIVAFIFANLGPSSTNTPVGSLVYNQTLAIQNASLAGITTYSQGATTQFSTILIAIIIAILIGLFYLFYSNFISKRNARRSGGGYNGGGGSFQ